MIFGARYITGLEVGVSGSYPTKAVALLLGESRAYAAFYIPL